MDDRCGSNGTDVLFTSIAMGILVTFGSYMKKDVSIEGSTTNVEIFDTAIAIMAGLMIIRQSLHSQAEIRIHCRQDRP